MPSSRSTKTPPFVFAKNGDLIRKPSAGSSRAFPNLVDYEQDAALFDWDRARDDLEGLPPGRGLNIAHEAVDRHAKSERAAHVALRAVAVDGSKRELTYRELRARTSRFANALRSLGIGKGDRVCALAGRSLELDVVCLGTLKNLSVFVPLGWKIDPERERVVEYVAAAEAKVLVTTELFYERTIAPIRAQLTSVEHVIVIGDRGRSPRSEAETDKIHDLGELLERSSSAFEIPPTDPEDLALIQFTSGRAGPPKATLHVHRAVVAHRASGKLALDLHPEDVFWCNAAAGSVTGVSYGVIAPLACGVTSVIDEADGERSGLDAERCYRILSGERVSVWYTDADTLRMLMHEKDAVALARRFDLRALRFVASEGDRLTREEVLWGIDAFGLPIHDTWSQAETGAIMIANYASMPIRLGSMGKPLPGTKAAVVRRKPDGWLEVIRRPNVEGELALRPGWPSMLRGYAGDARAADRYRRCFLGGWYLTGDIVRRDEDGYYWFVGRADDNARPEQPQHHHSWTTIDADPSRWR